MDEIKDLSLINPIIKVKVDLITEFANAVHWDFKRGVSLVHILLRAREVSGRGQILHTNLLELTLSLHGVLIDQ